MTEIILDSKTSKQYTLTDKSCKYYTTFFSSGATNGRQTVKIYLSSLIARRQISDIKLYTISCMTDIMNLLKNISPDCATVFINDKPLIGYGEIKSILESLTVAEYRTTSLQSLQSLTESKIALAREETIARNKLFDTMNTMMSNVNGLSLAQCEALQKTITELQD
jgi:hypothetical protein